MDRTNVIIVDDHDTYRFGIRANIEIKHSDIAVVGEAKSYPDFFALLETVHDVDVVLLDIKFTDDSGKDGFDIARRLRTERPEIKIIAISAEEASETIQKMLETGIEGFIRKSHSAVDTPAEAIRSVMAGLQYYGRDMAEIISRVMLAKRKNAKEVPEFTEQEKQIIEYCHQGLPAKLIADRMCISLKTVEYHKRKMFEKCDLNNSAELVRFALKNGIIRL